MSDAAPAAPFPRFRLLDVALTGCRRPEAVAEIVRMARDRVRGYVCVFAVDSLLKCHDDPRLAAVARGASMVLCDGMPLVFAGRRFARLDVDRCYGPDTMLETLDRGRAAGLRHYFYGGADEETSRRLQERLVSRFPGLLVVGREVPPFRPLTEDERREAAARIDASGADVVWVGLGTPKQDFWVSEMRPLLKAPVLIAVGAAFAFHAGTVRQAPRWMQRAGLEWLFRLCAEPRRLWRRYLLGNPRFLWLAARQWMTGRPAPLGAVERPAPEPPPVRTP